MKKIFKKSSKYRSKSRKGLLFLKKMKRALFLNFLHFYMTFLKTNGMI